MDYLHFSFDLERAESASVYDECSLWAARFGLVLLQHLELRADVDILDLACGPGFPLFELAHMYGPSCRVTGVDSWSVAIQRARAKLDVYQLSNVQVLEADAAHLPFSEASFDLLVSNLGINNFADPGAVLAECFRVARPNARLHLTTNPIGHMHEFYTLFREVLFELQKEQYLERLAVHEAHRGTKEELGNLLRSQGFRVHTIKEEPIQLRYLNGTAFFNHFLTKIGFVPGWRQVVDPEDEVPVFALLEEKLNQRASQSGELRLTIPLLYLEAEKPA